MGDAKVFWGADYGYMHDLNCYPESWWSGAVDSPMGAITSPLYQLMLLESPDRWLALEEVNCVIWAAGYAKKLKHAKPGLFFRYIGECLTVVQEQLAVYEEMDEGKKSYSAGPRIRDLQMFIGHYLRLDRGEVTLGEYREAGRTLLARSMFWQGPWQGLYDFLLNPADTDPSRALHDMGDISTHAMLSPVLFWRLLVPYLMPERAP